MVTNSVSMDASDSSNTNRRKRSRGVGRDLMYRITADDVAWARIAIDRAFPPLSEEQARFVTVPVAPTVMIAAAGSGKTRCLQEKLDREIIARGAGAVQPHVISFSNAAAQHFQDEFVDRRGPGYQGGARVAATLHAWCKRHFVPSEPRVSAILRCTLAWMRRRANGAWLRLLVSGQLMLVDEAQDCTPEQLEILRLLQAQGMEILLVGDPRQSIFGFTGATPSGMQTFSQNSLSLPTNFRSTRAIIRAANALCTLNAGRATNLEHLPLQTAGPDAKNGERPTIQWCDTLQSYSLGAIRDLLEQPRSRPACVITYMNADVEKLHQNLSMLGLRTIPILANEDGETLPLARDLTNDASYVHVRTMHSVKGYQYGTVIVVVKGFDTEEDALAAFNDERGEDTPSREEELRRYYVALTRAKEYLHVVVYGRCPPVWWKAVIDDCRQYPEDHAFKVILSNRCFATASSERDGEQQEKPLTIGELCQRHKAADYLISYRLGITPAVDPGETAPGVVRAGALASHSEMLPLQQEVDVRAPEVLRRFQIGILQRQVLLFHAQHQLAPFALKSSVEYALTFLQKIPLLPSVLKKLEKLGSEPLRESVRAVVPKLPNPTFYPALAALLSAFLQNPGHTTSFDLMTRFLGPRADAVGLGSWDLNMIRMDLIEKLVQLPNAGTDRVTTKRNLSGRYLVGASHSVSIAHVVNMLADVIDGADVDASAMMFREMMFRERVTILDSEDLVPCRCDLIRAGKDFLQGSYTNEVMARCALLVYLCTPGGFREGRHRSLPFLAWADMENRLRLEDLQLSNTTAMRLTASIDALRERLHQHHTPEQLALASVHKSLLEESSERIPRQISGHLHVLVPGGDTGDTAVQLACGEAATLNDEAHALLAGAISKSARAFLYEVKSGTLFTFDISDPCGVVESACAGLRKESLEVVLEEDSGSDEESMDVASSRSRSRTPPLRA